AESAVTSRLSGRTEHEAGKRGDSGDLVGDGGERPGQERHRQDRQGQGPRRPEEGSGGGPEKEERGGRRNGRIDRRSAEGPAVQVRRRDAQGLRGREGKRGDLRARFHLSGESGRT